MYAMEIEAERRREVIGATKRNGRDGLRGHEKERRWSGTADVALATHEPRTREGSITERDAVPG